MRAACEFDKAAGVYENIVADFPEEAEAYWGLVLCKFGIEYVDDPATGKKIPTCHRSSFDSIMDDTDFEQVMENADSAARKIYREEAKAIEELRKGIIEVSSREEPYDIFICYKETDESGDRTIDSVIAQDIYDRLIEKQYRVFFARISLEDKLGTAYEPYIFAALNSARIMLAIGTDYDYYNAVWVKNEWSRFLTLMAKDKKKMLIPCYKNIDAYDIPKEFKHLQGQDMGKVGAMQDLLRGIDKILPKNTSVSSSSKAVDYYEKTDTAGTGSLLKRVRLFLDDGDWDSADRYCEKILDIDPENGEAYLCKLMAKNKVSSREEIIRLNSSIENDNDFKKAVRFGNDKLKNELNGYIEYIKKRDLYNYCLSILTSTHNTDQLLEIKDKLNSVDFNDSKEKEKQCEEKYKREKEILSLDKNRCAELNQVFLTLSEKENEIKEKTSEVNQINVYNDERVPAQDYLDSVQSQMNDLMEKLKSLGAFKKKEKEAVSAKIVQVGKEISRLNQEVETQKQQRTDEYRRKKYVMWETIHELEREVNKTKEDLYNEAIQNEDKKMFDSAHAIYTNLKEYRDCAERLLNVQQEKVTYRNAI